MNVELQEKITRAVARVRIKIQEFSKTGKVCKPSYVGNKLEKQKEIQP